MGHSILTPRWGIWYTSWVMFQYAFDWTFSLGIHLDPKRRHFGATQIYGPYLDLHFLWFALSIGYHPARAWNHSLMRPELGQDADTK